LIILIYFYRDEWTTFLDDLKKVIIEKRNEGIRNKVDINISGDINKKNLYENENLYLIFDIVTHQNIKLLNYIIKSDQLEILEDLNNLPLFLEKDTEYSLKITVKPFSFGVGKYHFHLIFEDNIKNSYLNQFLGVSAPYIETNSFDIHVFPLRPKLFLKCAISKVDSLDLLFDITNSGRKSAKHIKIELLNKEEVQIIQYIKKIDELKSNISIKRNLLLNINNNLENDLNFHLVYKDIDNNEFDEKFDIKMVDVNNLLISSHQQSLMRLIPEIKFRSFLFDQAIEKIKQFFVDKQSNKSIFFDTINHEIFKHIIDYKRNVEEVRWEKIIDYEGEKEFHKDLYSYLNKEDIFPDSIQFEPKKELGKPDLVISNTPIEIKLLRRKNQVNKLDKYLNQLLAYCVSYNSIIGFLIVFYKYRQNETPNYPKIDDIELHYMIEKEKTPIILISIIIRTGIQNYPSKS
jgi:hypothetical protein